MTKDITRGERIPESQFYREFCDGCGIAMRVTEHWVGHRPTCETCGGKHRSVRGGAPWDSDSFGYQSIAIRALEDQEWMVTDDDRSTTDR